MPTLEQRNLQSFRHNFTRPTSASLHRLDRLGQFLRRHTNADCGHLSGGNWQASSNHPGFLILVAPSILSETTGDCPITVLGIFLNVMLYKFDLALGQRWRRSGLNRRRSRITNRLCNRSELTGVNFPGLFTIRTGGGYRGVVRFQKTLQGNKQPLRKSSLRSGISASRRAGSSIPRPRPRFLR